ncbi:carboxypeptidase-like regulatory domain-containing protein [Hymenobacter sp. BT664]|uniref:Carboxypeptidase-like regulatory domain-containing protein n=1 Tax=Hymenobacter montanus TaxID=2771359 RepID=A0A927BAM9_9BACT|nr:carboxypeptidase regulatory-like domain-containing protein [Hymenobacter montanus]MBD2767196.1 carboxypeptidase-like regulatory domain-containing protein [Hymenobacter montanus]
MRLFLFLIAITCAGITQSVMAQSTSRSDNSVDTQGRITLSTQTNAPVPAPAATRPMRLACVPLSGEVFDPNGRPLAGATLHVKGTQQVYVTDSEGMFLFTGPVYDGQEVTVGAAGYIPQDVALTDCNLPRLVLEQEPGARIKRSGKRSGQVLRLNNRNTNLK